MDTRFIEEIPIAENLVLRNTENRAVFAVVFRGSAQLGTVLERIDIADQWPIVINRLKLAKAIKSGEYSVDHSYASSRVMYLTSREKSADPPKGKSRNRIILPAAETGPGKKKVDDERWELVQRIVGTEEYFHILYGYNRTRNLNKLANRLKCSRQHITNLLKLYWRNGLSKAGVQSDLDKCGRGMPRNSKDGNRLGGPRTYAVDEGLGQPSNEETRKYLQLAADFYLHSKKVIDKTTHKVTRKVTYEKAINYIVELFYTRRPQI